MSKTTYCDSKYVINSNTMKLFAEHSLNASQQLLSAFQDLSGIHSVEEFQTSCEEYIDCIRKIYKGIDLNRQIFQSQQELNSLLDFFEDDFSL